MYSVLLVDDEDNILEILKHTIRWKELGVSRVLVAKNAQQALSELSIHEIDLMISDIKMPGMDGINLIKQVRASFPEVRCVLLSAYGEFAYAREAIELGVENYLLKPISQVEVEQTVWKAFDNIYAKKKNNRDLLKENILQRWVNGSISEEELSDRAMILNINLYLPAYSVICFQKTNDENVQRFISKSVNLLKAEHEVYFFWENKSRFVVIVGGKHFSAELSGCQLSELAEICGVQDAIRIAIGTMVSDIMSLQLSYQFARECLEMNNPHQNTVVLRQEWIDSGIDVDCMVEHVREICFENDTMVRENLSDYIVHKLYDSIKEGASDQILTQLLGICTRVLSTEFLLQNQAHSVMYQQIWRIEKNQTKDDFCTEAKRILQKAKEYFDQYYAAYRPIVQLAIQYAQKNAEAGSGGSLKEFCTKNHTNAAYLGHIFKKETGSFFNEYFIQCCINRSILLLKNPNNKVKSISERVGFSSVSYFVKCFRLNKGTSPAKYRMRKIDV